MSSHYLSCGAVGVESTQLCARLPGLKSGQFTKLCTKRAYMDAAQILLNHDPVISNNFIGTTFVLNDLAGPIVLLPKIGKGCVVTTNFDNALEIAFGQAS
jgi:hypothetical protein